MPRIRRMLTYADVVDEALSYAAHQAPGCSAYQYIYMLFITEASQFVGTPTSCFSRMLTYADVC
jgi:hypothetical protein